MNQLLDMQDIGQNSGAFKSSQKPIIQSQLPEPINTLLSHEDRDRMLSEILHKLEIMTEIPCELDSHEILANAAVRESQTDPDLKKQLKRIEVLVPFSPKYSPSSRSSRSDPLQRSCIHLGGIQKGRNSGRGMEAQSKWRWTMGHIPLFTIQET